MLHVEAVIKMLDPAFNLRRIAVKRRQPNPWFKRGTVYRRAVDALRTEEEWGARASAFLRVPRPRDFR
jgi:hypothetical protein